MWIAPGSVLTLQTLHDIRNFECHNLLFRHHNLLQSKLTRACSSGPRAKAPLGRPALLER